MFKNSDSNLNKKKNDSCFQESPPRIIEIEEQEIKEKKPPVDNIIYYKIAPKNDNSQLEKK